MDVGYGLARHHRVVPAGVVADHAPDRAESVGGGVGTEGQIVLLCSVAQLVADDARLHACDLFLGVELDDLTHVFREVHYDRDVAALAVRAGAAAAREDWRPVSAAGGDGLYDVFGVPRYNNPDRDLPVDRIIRRIKRPAAAVEAHLPADYSLAEFVLQRPSAGILGTHRPVRRAAFVPDCASHELLLISRRRFRPSFKQLQARTMRVARSIR